MREFPKNLVQKFNMLKTLLQISWLYISYVTN